MGAPFEVFEPTGAETPVVVEIPHAGIDLLAPFLEPLTAPARAIGRDADLYVAGTPQGRNFDGAIDFLRIARGTLADSKTTIDELYAWEFNGPFLSDFTGRPRPSNGGEAGAIDE